MTLEHLRPGQSARIEAVGGEGALRQHFLDMGVIPGVTVRVMKLAPLGDPMELRIHGYELTLRLADAAKIEISKPFDRVEPPRTVRRSEKQDHPGLGEDGKFHPKGSGNPLPDGTLLSFALARTSTSAISPASPLTGRTASSAIFPTPGSRTCRASTPCLPTPARSW